MQSHRNSTIWDNLSLSGDHIRLLTVHEPTDDPKSIQCSLKVVSLAHRPLYAALSYTWGRESRDHHVLIDSVQVAVTRSCYEALKIFRDEWFDVRAVLPARDTCGARLQALERQRLKVLWVDQLCVDQTSMKERASQVLLMRQIYSGAAVVWCYVGIPPSYESVQSLMRSVHKDLESSITPGQSAGESLRAAVSASETSMDGWIKAGALRPADAPEILQQPSTWIYLSLLFQRPYFNRRWIVQEVSLNKDVYIYWDGALFQFEMVIRCNTLTNTLHYQSYAASFYPSFDAWSHLKSFITSTPGFTSGPILLTARSFTNQVLNQSPGTIYFRLLALCRVMEQSESQDVFFALRSFVSVDTEMLPVEYSKTVTEIALSHALYFLHAGLVAALLQFGGPHHPEDGLKFPSWCPKWHRHDLYTARPLSNRVLLAGSKMPKELSSTAVPWKHQRRDHGTTTHHSLRIKAILETTISALFVKRPSPRTLIESAELGDHVRYFLYQGFAQSTRAAATTTTCSSADTHPPNHDNIVSQVLTTLQSQSISDNINDTERLMYKYDVLPLLELGLSALKRSATTPDPASISHNSTDEEKDHIWSALGQIVPLLTNPTRSDQLVHTLQFSRFENGAIGVVDSGAQEGDVVALVPGCWLPLVLRQKEKNGSTEQELQPEDTYEIVGSAFILDLRGMRYLNMADDEEYPVLQLSDEDMKKLSEIVVE